MSATEPKQEEQKAVGRSSWRGLLVLVGIGLLLCAVPFAGGVACIGLAVSLLGDVKRRRLEAIRHGEQDPPTPVAQAAAGQTVRVTGTVQPATVQPTTVEPGAVEPGAVHPAAPVVAPLGGDEVAFAAVEVQRETKGRQHKSFVPLLTERWGERIELRDSSGLAVVLVGASGIALLTKHEVEEKRYGEPSPGPLRDAIAEHAPKFAGESLTLKVTERVIRFGDELSVVGRVQHVEQTAADEQKGYRSPGAETRITIGPRVDGSLLVSNYEPQDTAASLAGAAVLRVAAALLLLIGPASLIAWLWFFLRSA